MTAPRRNWGYFTLGLFHACAVTPNLCGMTSNTGHTSLLYPALLFDWLISFTLTNRDHIILAQSAGSENGVCVNFDARRGARVSRCDPVATKPTRASPPKTCVHQPHSKQCRMRSASSGYSLPTLHLQEDSIEKTSRHRKHPAFVSCKTATRKQVVI